MATTYEVSEGIATLTLNRPERLNAFNEDLVKGALKAVDEARIDPAVKALVLTGNGRGFCAGADLAGLLAPTGEGVNAAMRDLYNQHGPAWKDYDDMATFFSTTGIAGLAAQNRLSVEENLELFVCRNTTRIVELLLEGMTRDDGAAALVP